MSTNRNYARTTATGIQFAPSAWVDATGYHASPSAEVANYAVDKARFNLA